MLGLTIIVEKLDGNVLYSYLSHGDRYSILTKHC